MDFFIGSKDTETCIAFIHVCICEYFGTNIEVHLYFSSLSFDSCIETNEIEKFWVSQSFFLIDESVVYSSKK